MHPPTDVPDGLPLPGVPLPPIPTGPTPTLIEYSGYGYADPAGPQSGIAVLANLMGFTVVDVNMRGTGCSGGAFDFFEPLQSLDGYDVIETIARQPWVKHGKVGMMGISYGGISQLFTAADQPAEPRRDLAAVGDRRRRRRRSTRAASSTPASPSTWAKERDPRGAGRRPGRRPAVGLRAHPGGRQDLRGQPGAARRGGRPDGEDPRQRPLLPEGRRPAVAGHVRRQDQGAVVHGLPVEGRADRRPLPDAGRAASPARTGSGSRSRTARTSTRSTPETFNRWYDFLQLYVAKQAPIMNSALIRAAGAGHLPGGDGHRRA